jgi:peptide/nickel transport system substrate-binding protein
MQFPSVEVGVIEPNNRRPGLSDVAVRQAMMYAWDRQAVLDGFSSGQGQLATGIIPPALKLWYNPNVQRYPFDPARARAILDAAGWKPGPDGVRQKGGTRLEFDALVNQGSVIVLDELLAFSADQAAVGIKINVRQLDFPSIIEREYAGTYDLAFEDEGGSSDPDVTDNFGSAQIPPAGRNTTFTSDPVLDGYLARGLRELDPVRRRAIYDKMQARLAVTLPMLWEIVPNSGLAHSRRLRLDPATTLPFPFLWYNVQDWQLRP